MDKGAALLLTGMSETECEYVQKMLTVFWTKDEQVIRAMTSTIDAYLEIPDARKPKPLLHVVK